MRSQRSALNVHNSNLSRCLGSVLPTVICRLAITFCLRICLVILSLPCISVSDPHTFGPLLASCVRAGRVERHMLRVVVPLPCPWSWTCLLLWLVPVWLSLPVAACSWLDGSWSHVSSQSQCFLSLAINCPFFCPIVFVCTVRDKTVFAGGQNQNKTITKTGQNQAKPGHYY